MGHSNRGRTKYSKLLAQTAWGVYSEPVGGKLHGTCSAATKEEAQAVFDWHNERNPEWAIHGYLREVSNA